MKKTSFRLGLLFILGVSRLFADRQILNASIDVSRELYAAINPAFVAQWSHDKGETFEVKQSHRI